MGATSAAGVGKSTATARHSSGTEAAPASSPGSRKETTSPNTASGTGATELDNISVGSGGGSSLGQGGGAGSGQGGHAGGPLPQQRDLICLCTPAPKVPRPRNGELMSSSSSSCLFVSPFWCTMSLGLVSWAVEVDFGQSLLVPALHCLTVEACYTPLSFYI